MKADVFLLYGGHRTNVTLSRCSLTLFKKRIKMKKPLH